MDADARVRPVEVARLPRPVEDVREQAPLAVRLDERGLHPGRVVAPDVVRLDRGHRHLAEDLDQDHELALVVVLGARGLLRDLVELELPGDALEDRVVRDLQVLQLGPPGAGLGEVRPERDLPAVAGAVVEALPLAAHAQGEVAITEAGAAHGAHVTPSPSLR